jgi:hypothetical protein
MRIRSLGTQLRTADFRVESVGMTGGCRFRDEHADDDGRTRTKAEESWEDSFRL